VRAGIEAYERTGAGQLLPYAYTMLGEILGLSGRTADGLDAIRSATAAADCHGLDMYAAETLRIRGEILLRAGDESGLGDLEAACTLARRQDAASLELRGALTYLDWARTSEHRSGARRLLEAALSHFPDAADGDQGRARAALAS
jgi:hypothetical protein